MICLTYAIFNVFSTSIHCISLLPPLTLSTSIPANQYLNPYAGGACGAGAAGGGGAGPPAGGTGGPGGGAIPGDGFRGVKPGAGAHILLNFLSSEYGLRFASEQAAGTQLSKNDWSPGALQKQSRVASTAWRVDPPLNLPLQGPGGPPAPGGPSAPGGPPAGGF
jgi:hypothetical protein